MEPLYVFICPSLFLIYTADGCKFGSQGGVSDHHTIRWMCMEPQERKEEGQARRRRLCVRMRDGFRIGHWTETDAALVPGDGRQAATTTPQFYVNIGSFITSSLNDD